MAAALLMVLAGAIRCGPEWLRHRAVAEPKGQSTSPSTVVISRPEHRIAELRRSLAASPPFGALEMETAAPADELRRLLERFARQDPLSTLADIKALTGDATARYKMASIVVRIWAASDPPAAWAWTCTADDAWSCRDQPPLRCSALPGMAASSPDYLVAAITARARATAESDLIAPATAALLHAGQFQRAENAWAEWSRYLPDVAIAGVTVQLMVNELSRHDPAEALAWVESLPPSANRNAAEATLAARWAETAPRAAVAWAASLSSPAARDSALEGAFYAWSDGNPEAAIEWLAQNPREPMNDRLIAGLVSRPAFRAANPRQAVQLAEAIEDVDARRQALKTAILTWSGFDSNEATRYAREAAGLTDPQRAEIIQAIQQHSDFRPY